MPLILYVALSVTGCWNMVVLQNVQGNITEIVLELSKNMVLLQIV